MSPREITNVVASLHQRLLNLARARNEDFGLLLTRYASERFLYRLAASPQVDNYVLKGATLFSVWTNMPHRPTRDIDLAGYGDPSASHLRSIIEQVCLLPVEDDGMRFHPATLRIETIRDDQEYEGLRARLKATLGKAETLIQVDVGFGDAVSPAPTMGVLPTLLGTPGISLRVYPMEAVIAEKLHAMVLLSITNSRMKDFFDIYTLAQSFEFGGTVLANSIRETFQRRSTPIPADTPLALTAVFSGDAAKQAQWSGFLRRSGIEPSVSLPEAVDLLRRFLTSPLEMAAGEAGRGSHWSPKEGWSHID